MKRLLKNTAIVGAMITFTAGCSLPYGLSEKLGLSDLTAQNDHTPVKPKDNDSDKGTQKKTDKKTQHSKDTQSTDTDKPLLKETIKQVNGKNVVTNPNSILVCADKHRNLPSDYVPPDLVVPDIPFSYGNNKHYEKMNMRKVAAVPIKHLFQAAEEDGIKIYAVSGYRSYQYQVTVFNHNVEKYGSVEKANQVSAEPGQSEHQTGLSMDVTSTEVGDQLIQDFGNTKAGNWLAANAWKYGFIIRYPKGKEAITGYEYEPWHIRYVGKKAAKVIHENHLTLEEYLSK